MKLLKSAGIKDKKIHEIPPYLIYPNRNHTRSEFSDASLALLASSIKKLGILQPLIVRSGKRGGYELVAGERRLRAAVLGGLLHVPCIVVGDTEADAEYLSIVENCEREALTPYDSAKAVKRLVEHYNGDTAYVARLLSKSPETVEKLCRLSTLSRSELQAMKKYRRDESAQLLFADIPIKIRLDVIRLCESKNLSKSALGYICEKARTCDSVKQLESIAERLSGDKEEKTTVVLHDLAGFYSTVENACSILTKAGVKNILTYNEDETEATVCVKIKK